MPFSSDKQRKWMFANEPDMAKRWAKHEESVEEAPKLGVQTQTTSVRAPNISSVFSKGEREKLAARRQPDDAVKNFLELVKANPGSDQSKIMALAQQAQMKGASSFPLKNKIAFLLKRHAQKNSDGTYTIPPNKEIKPPYFTDGPVTEMPHIDANIDLGGKHMEVIDLRIERYPVPPEEKKRLMKAFSKRGVVGNFNGELLHFKPDYTVDVVDQDAARQLPMLPRGWEKHMQYVTESNDGSIPKNEHLPDPKDGGKFIKTAPTYAIQIEEPFTVNTIEGEAEAKAGDFLAQGPNGDMWPVDQTIFKQSYKPVDSPKMEKVFKRK